MTSVINGSVSFQRPEPVVIHESLLKSSVLDQVEPEISEIAKSEGVAFDSVKVLKLDYRNILKINNLQFLTGLTKLCLDNNIIEKIENLDCLTNLTWLDLSFNNITVIEGLDKLVNLTDLTLFNNKIAKIENLENLEKLQVLSLGNNDISQLESIVYLTKFHNLKVVNLSGNPVCSLPNYRTYVLAYLRKLCYFDYRIIDQEELKKAKEIMINEQILLEEEEKAELVKQNEKKALDIQNNQNEAAHIKGFDTLFLAMFSNDPDYQRLVPLTTGMTNEPLKNFESQWNTVHSQFYKFALDKANSKTNEIEMLRQAIQKAKQNACSNTRKKYNEFEHEKKVAFRKLAKLVSVAEINQTLTDIKTKWKEYEHFLLSQEMQLVEGIEDVLKDFERNYTELCSSITENSSAVFAQLRQLELEYHEQYSEQILNAFERYSKGDYEETTDEIRELINDKEVVSNALASSHDYRISCVDAQEDILTVGIAKDLEQTVSNLLKEETARNRNVVSEILSFKEKVLQEIEQVEENLK